MIDPADPRAIIGRLYRGVDAFEIPPSEERAVRASRGSPIYGELTPTGISRMLEHLGLGERDVFYDLGSGAGKVVLQAAISTPARKCIGVELSGSRVRAANRVLRVARRQGLLRARACAFRNQDILATYLADATVIYTCSTAFSARFLARVAARVAALSRPLRFLTLQPLDRLPRGFEEVTTLGVPTTWTRRAEVEVYRVAATGKGRV